MKILIAEDTLTSRRFLELQLARLGHEVESTTDGAAALRIHDGAARLP